MSPMRDGLFWRMFSAILAVVTVTVALFTAMLLATQRTQAQENYETEVRMQARQVAEYMQQLNQLNLIKSNATIQWLVNEKIVEIYDPRIEKLQQELTKKHGFLLLRHVHILSGICADCQKKMQQ